MYRGRPLYIDGQKADLFEDENIQITLDNPKRKGYLKGLWGLIAMSFTIAGITGKQCDIFKHYYNVDVYRVALLPTVRADAFIEVNNNRIQRMAF